jgi:hypothetical protein
MLVVDADGIGRGSRSKWRAVVVCLTERGSRLADYLQRAGHDRALCVDAACF